MLSVSDLIKKARCGFKELKCELHNETYRAESGKDADIVYDHYDEDEYECEIKDLYFFEYFQKNHPELLNMRSMIEFLHGLTYENEEESTVTDGQRSSLENPSIEYPVHPYVRAVHFMGRIYLAFKMESLIQFRPKSLSHVYEFVNRCKKSLNDIHSHNLYVSNIAPASILWDGNDINTLSFSSNLPQQMKKAVFQNQKSIIIGTQCISPYQIIWDMMHSKYELDDIEYTEFKRKLKMFWENTVKAEFCLVPSLCQSIYGKHTGQNYLDYVIKKWCVIKQEDGKTYIHKSTSKVTPVDNLYMIDWFCLGVQIVRYLEILNNDVKKTTSATDYFQGYPKDLMNLIYKCITMEVNDEDRQIR